MCWNCDNDTTDYDPRGGFSDTQLFYLQDYSLNYLEEMGIFKR